MKSVNQIENQGTHSESKDSLRGFSINGGLRFLDFLHVFVFLNTSLVASKNQKVLIK